MRSLTQLVGSAANNSATLYPTSFTTLTGNNSVQNVALGTNLVNDQLRYLIQKYFDNERTVQTTTVGGMSLTTTGSLSAGAVVATLTASWTYPTVTQLVNFSDGEQRQVLFTNGLATITWAVPLNDNVTSSISSVGVQDYAIPANISKIKNDTINVGQLKYQPTPVMSRQEWDTVNFLPYTSDIPNYFFIYNNNLSIWPIPSTTGNIITFNYKTRVADMTFADYSTGTLAANGMAPGSTSVTGLATSWHTTGNFPLNTNILYYNLYIKANPPFGDGIWYQISEFNSDTTLTLLNPVVDAPNITTATTYTIGQLPVLSEDFHDMLTYGALLTYYLAIVKDKDAYDKFKELYDNRLILLEDYAGTKSFNVDLETEPNQMNPNLFEYASPGNQ